MLSNRSTALALVVTFLAVAAPGWAQVPAAPAAPAGGTIDVTAVETLKRQLADKEVIIETVKQQAIQAQRQASEATAAQAQMKADIAQMKADLAAGLAARAEATAEATAVTDEISISDVVNNTNIMWTLIAGFLVMLMQAGFALVEAGFTRAKNCGHTVCMNLMDYCVGMLAYWVCGFAFMFGGSQGGGSLGPEGAEALNSMIKIGDWGVLGFSGFALAGDQFYAGSIFTLFLFQMVFMNTATTIPTGTLAERWKFLPFTLNTIVVGALIYPVYGCWVWGGGWLAQLGYTDFAGSSVVHLTGGVIALAGAIVVGPRYGKFNKNGTPNPIPGHNIPLAVLGTLMLAFGWFGFNAGSTLAGNDAQIGIIAANTMLASGAGAVVAMMLSWWRFGKPDPSFMCNGMLAGLVGITAPCAFVDAWASVVIGGVAGVLVVYSVFFIEEILKVDDPVGAISVHGTCGIWGVLSVGLLANGKYVESVKGVLFGGDPMFFLIQCLGVGVCIIWVGVTSYIVFQIQEALFGNRADTVDEISGLDIPETGALGYQADLNPESR